MTFLPYPSRVSIFGLQQKKGIWQLYAMEEMWKCSDGFGGNICWIQCSVYMAQLKISMRSQKSHCPHPRATKFQSKRFVWLVYFHGTTK